jgi:hypothetical protein
MEMNGLHCLKNQKIGKYFVPTYFSRKINQKVELKINFLGHGQINWQHFTVKQF